MILVSLELSDVEDEEVVVPFVEAYIGTRPITMTDNAFPVPQLYQAQMFPKCLSLRVVDDDEWKVFGISDIYNPRARTEWLRRIGKEKKFYLLVLCCLYSFHQLEV